MTRKAGLSLLAIAMLSLAACGGNGTEDPAAVGAPDKSAVDKTQLAEQARDNDYVRIPATPGSPFQFDYKVIGTPVVGSPVSFDLQIKSVLGNESIEVGYQIVDETALMMPEAQPSKLTVAPLAGEEFVRERVTVIPQREGRMYFNVSAAVRTEEGTTSTVISIPLHVGEVDTGLVEHGELQTDEEGETTRVLKQD